ncbi:MAG: winged helix-turn-helix domain-containing protein [Prevotella sp.]|nr:winged helix-turn-helix domain-containing protein [Prevotella sp.]MDD7605944.1 winged helix-turn-helix domain-containing protein [Prevotellaceae bacterium]MDY3248390.1 winged helix-turn-helix domain-containing protein [Prevotella sp.]
MTEKKATKAATTKKSTAAKKTATKKTAVKGSVVLNAENVGFKAGDVYQALATAEKPMSVAEIAKSAKITEDEVLVGMGWLFKEGKIKDEDDKVVLA